MSCWHRFKNSDDIKSVKSVRRYNGNASNRESRNRIPDDTAAAAAATTTTRTGTNTDGDTKAVDWWRNYQEESDVVCNNEFVSRRDLDYSISKTHVRVVEDVEDKRNNARLDDIPPPTVSPLIKSLEKSQMRMQYRNPLEKPYDILHRKLPIKPQNRMVLHPRLLPPKDSRNDMKMGANPSLGIFKTRGRSYSNDGTDRMEVFQPQVVPSPSQRKRQPQPQKQSRHITAPPQTREISTIQHIDVRSEGKEPSDEYISNIAVKNKSNNQSLPSAMQKNQDTSKEEKKQEKLSLSKFIEIKSNTPLATKAKAATMNESSDHLSDVPSDVDSVTRERYLLACQMLKMTIIQKETALIPIEKEYILSLLEDVETNAGDDSAVSENRVTATERAILRLDSDPIFQHTIVTKPPNDAANIYLPPPTTAARVQRIQKTSNDKNPHTATRKPKKKFMERISNPCKSLNSAKSIERESDTSDDEEFVIVKNGVPLGNIGVTSGDERDHLVRFDGWSFQNSIEYPFSILGADGNDMSPRVITPAMMEALRGFMPFKVNDYNFWLKFSLVRDGASLATLLATVRTLPYTMIGVETDYGEVFGSFTGTPWRIGGKWYGSGEAFLWRLKKRRYTSPTNSRKSNFEREMEIYPCTGDDKLVQYCTAKTIAVGGGDWQHNSCPYSDSDQGIGFMVDGDLAGGETNSCATFSNPKLAKHTTSSSEFVIRNLEVWTLTPCINLEDATKMELHRMLVEEDEIF